MDEIEWFHRRLRLYGRIAVTGTLLGAAGAVPAAWLATWASGTDPSWVLTQSQWPVLIGMGGIAGTIAGLGVCHHLADKLLRDIERC